MDVPLGEEIDPHRVLQPRVEAEIGFVFGRDVGQAMPTTTDILRATDYVVAAIEVVGSRIANWDIRIVDTLADSASSGLFALGHQIRRLSAIASRVSVTSAVYSASKLIGCVNSRVSEQ